MNDAIRKIKDRLAAKGVTDFEIYSEENRGVTIEARDGAVEAFERDSSRGFGLRVLNSGRFGFAYATSAATDAIDYAVASAVQSLSQATQDARCALISPPDHYPAVANWDARLENISRQEKIGMVLHLEESARRFDPAIARVRSAIYTENCATIRIENSNGVSARHQRSHVSLSIMPIAERGGESEMAYDSRGGTAWDCLQPDILARETAAEAVSRLGGRRLGNLRGPILLIPALAVEMLELLAPSALAENIHKKNSFLIGKKGKRIYADTITLVDDGLHPDGASAQPFDAEGWPRQKTPVIQQGVVENYLYDAFWARQDGVPSTGNAERGDALKPPVMGMSNFYLEPGKQSPAELVRSMDRGAVITEAIGMHTADAISGDFSVGVQGTLVAGGLKKHPLRSMALTGNLHTLLDNVVAVGNDLKFYGNVASPSLLVKEASLAGG